jgi:hypothetical protein
MFSKKMIYFRNSERIIKMQLTIDIKDSALDKVLYLLENLKSDVKIVSTFNDNTLDIETISKNDKDYKHLIFGRKERKENPENYGTIDDVNWN